MEALKKSNIQSKVVLTSKEISITETYFSSSATTSSAYYSLQPLFYPTTGSALEFIQFQDRTLHSGENMIWYQVPYNKRGIGIKENTFSLTYNNLYVISDDGDGNLIHNDENVGNVFYNTGLVFITGTGSFSGSGTSVQNIAENASLVQLDYERYVEYKIDRYILNVESNKYTMSSNISYSGSNAPHPYLTRAYLYNANNDVVMEMAISRPIPLKTELTLMGEIYDTIQ